MAKNDTPIDGSLLAMNASLELKIKSAEKARDEYKSRADTAEGKLVALQAEHDKLVEQVRADSEESPSKLREAMTALHEAMEAARADAAEARSDAAIEKRVRERVNIERRAALVLGEKARFDGMTTRQVKVTTIARLYGAGKDVDEAGQPRSDEYISAMFDRGTEGYEQSRDALARVRAATIPEQTGGEQRADQRDAYEQHQERMQNKWRTAGARKSAEVK